MILPALQGPHVPRFVARGDFSHEPYIVMERIDGPSAASAARRGAARERRSHRDRLAGKPPHCTNCNRQHLVHLDVKPSNIVFRPDGTAVMVDFGLSHHDRLPDLLDEEFSLPMGTGPYISPRTGSVRARRSALRPGSRWE